MRADPIAPSRSIVKKAASPLLGVIFRSFMLTSSLLSAVAQYLFVRTLCLDFEPQPDDIFIVSYPRSGATWLQMILYQLATDADMNIPHISQRIPFFEAGMVFNRL